MYKTSVIDREILKFWKQTSPLSAFSAGLKQYAGKMWIPSKENKKKALEKIGKLLKKAGKDRVATKFLRAERFGLLFEEPHDVPGGIMGHLYNHVLVEGFRPGHLSSLAKDGMKVLFLQKHLLKKDWPVELRIMTMLECDGCIGVIEAVKKNVKNARLHKLLDSLASGIRGWRSALAVGRLKRGDFSEVYPLLKRKGQGFRREKVYPRALRAGYDYPETPREIEQKALGWLLEEIPKLNAIIAKLAVKLKCKPAAKEVELGIKRAFPVPRSKLVSTINGVRKVLQPVAEEHWVRITPKYDIRVIETPKYLVPFLPSAAMNSFGALTKKPFCVFFATTDPRGSPADSLPELAQMIIHEEYGHCVNFMNSYTGFLGKLRLVEVVGSSLDTPITEGLSFHREIEALHSFRHLEHKEVLSKKEQKWVDLVQKYQDFEMFNDAMEYVVRKWRAFRFLRAISDSRVNTGKQKYASFVDWASGITGLPKKLIYDQTFFFQEHPGYAPCYSIFGQRLSELQKKAFRKGISRVEFNTFVESKGFPARTLFEKHLRKRFRI
jgi:hypothetical protein